MSPRRERGRSARVLQVGVLEDDDDRRSRVTLAKDDLTLKWHTNWWTAEADDAPETEVKEVLTDAHRRESMS